MLTWKKEDSQNVKLFIMTENCFWFVSVFSKDSEKEVTSKMISKDDDLEMKFWDSLSMTRCESKE